ncbi:cell division control protein 6 homolog isoform X1 [Acropora millepora]|uniref:cell division control protein 6 homolog isoform X1 n=1 Tax=Acropora millepora TaxID=45264 RepID=UPI001CF12C96|nr:cell division control protein 6 homolog isoform X1 [Acropora millepora]
MPRVTRSSQRQIEFQVRKSSRTQHKANEQTINAEASDGPLNQACSISPRKRRSPPRAVERKCFTVSPKKRRSNRSKQEDVFSDPENSDPKPKLSLKYHPEETDTPPLQQKKKDKLGKTRKFISDENANCPEPKQMLSLARQDGHQYSMVRRALHSSHPENLLCREDEIAEISSFLQSHLTKGKPGSLYISGAPGTGKTACLTKIMFEMKNEIRKCQVVFVNCMALRQPQDIFRKIAVELVGEENCPAKATLKFLEEEFSSSKLIRIIILDELDQLESKNQEILYTMFELPSLPKSKLILIGIANALDLTDRILPRLQARPKCKPKLLHFAPYTKDQIVKILQDRLTGVEEGNSVLDTSAVQFCARKVSAMAGDMRKALDICRRAVEVVESGERKQQILQPVQTDGSPSKRQETPPKPKRVGISQIASVVAEVYGSRLVAGPGVEQPTIPLQQKLLICTFLLMTKERSTKEVVLGKFHDTYCKICSKRKVSQLGQEDFLGLCNILETRGLLGIKRAKATRMMKVTLKIDEKEVDYALQDKTLLSSILQEGMPTDSKH